MLNESLIAKTEKKVYDFLPHEPETISVTLFIIGMTVYYLWRMFAITPIYDELYTYYNFISRGPLYAALHWTMPDDHIGYAVIASLLNLFGNPFIGLRGLSFICAITNLILVYKIAGRYYSHGLPLAATILYASMKMVNDFSVQGRGYTLSITCFLASIYLLGDVCRAGEDKKPHFKLLGFFMILGIYTVPVSVLWVIPTCVAAVFFLLVNGMRSSTVYKDSSDNVYYKKLRGLLGVTISSVLITTFLYSALWLSIGSNVLLAGDRSFEMYDGLKTSVLLRTPGKAWYTGADMMMSQAYVQRFNAESFSRQFGNWIFDVLERITPGVSMLVVIFIIIGITVLLVECVRHFEYSRTVINLIVIFNFLLVGVLLIVRHELPYAESFSFGGVLISLCICGVLEKIINFGIRIHNSITGHTEVENLAHREIEVMGKNEKWYHSMLVYVPVFLIFVYFLFRASSPEFNMQMGDRENDLFNSMYVANIDSRENIAAIDCDERYLLKFGWDIDCLNTTVTGCDLVILDKVLLEDEYAGENHWKFYVFHDDIDWDYLETMHVKYENENFLVYTK
ncbi:glycosyltransferase family 39 protein [Butyrivibrio sp. MC2021]|uniref:glycosyltransferase family 39 protein n=1 Tax=Butyrivibrio sp. MC2021 TaxID=1408306 RepID=UPI00047D7A0E|nr:glycosyltransferase family 39 protein [Butyrivibrio sp. MC2021]